MVPTEAIDTDYSRKDDGLPHTHIRYFFIHLASFMLQWSI